MLVRVEQVFYVFLGIFMEISFMVAVNILFMEEMGLSAAVA